MSIKDIWQNGLAVLRARYFLRQADLIGPKVRVWGKPVVKSWGNLAISDRVRLVSTIATTEIVVGGEGKLTIGASTFINYGCSIAAEQLVEIGANCSIGTYVMIMDNNFHRLEPDRRNERPCSHPIRLGDNVWLGGRVIILPGVTIGNDSVIGAGSVVTKNIPAGVVAGGVPAKVIRTL